MCVHMCECMFGNNRKRMGICEHTSVTVCIFLFILRCTALVFSKTIQTMCQTGFYYIGALYGSSSIV